MDMNKLWKFYRVRLDFTTSLCGSTPGDKELIRPWLEARKPRVRPPGGMSIDEIQEEVFASLPEEEPEFSFLVFQRNPENGTNLVVRAATIRAHMKDCSRKISSHIGKVEKQSSFATKVKNYVYPDENVYWVPVLRPDGSPVTEPDGKREKPIHVTDTSGRPQNALKAFEFVKPARIDFDLKVFCLGKEAVPIQDLETLFYYGGVHGYSGERSDGEGKYIFSITPVTEHESKPMPRTRGRAGRGQREHALT